MRVRFLDVARPDARGQAVDRVVGLWHDLVQIAERNRRHHRSEDFLLHHFHFFVGVDEDRRLDEVALVAMPCRRP